MSIRAERAWLKGRECKRLATVTALVGYDGRDMARITGSYQDLSPVDIAVLRTAVEKAVRAAMSERIGLRSIVHVEVEDGEDPEFQPREKTPAGGTAEVPED